jgi:hypothetical protein
MNTTPSALAEIQKLGGPSGYAVRMQNPAYVARVVQAQQLFEAACAGDRYAQMDFQNLMGGRPARSLSEAMSTSDYPILFGDTLNRSLATRYAQAQPIWKQFAARQVVRDFRPSKIIDFMGGGAVLDRVPELEEYPARAFAESQFTTTLAKYGDRLMWSWEMGINDDLGAFARAPQALSTGATSTEDYLATSVLANASGPLAWLGTAGNVPLTAVNLEAGVQKITDVVDSDGNPIDIGTPILMVPKALELTAKNIVNTTEVRQQNGSGSGSTITTTSGNGLSETPKIVVNRWLTAIDKSGTAKSTWYLLPDPNGPRPAVYETFLQGHETPDLRVKADGGMRLGGGAVDPMDGSFERDSVEYRIRHVVGGNQGFADAVYVSKGA